MNRIDIARFLEELAQRDLLIRVDDNLPNEAASVQTDSRAVRPGDMFVCIAGFTRDGHLFAPSAADKGAGLLVVERPLDVALPQIQVTNARRATALAARQAFDDPSRRMNLIGVTGTNGKTTIIHLADHILRVAGFRTGRIGTLGWAVDGEHHPLDRTTPDIIELNRILHTMAEDGVEYVVMEVSSHALALDRVYGLSFDLAVFSNLTRDHLDFHKDLEDYKQTKFLLFDYLLENDGAAIINIDDASGRELFDKLSGRTRSVSFQSGNYFIDKASSSLLGCEFELDCEGDRDHYNLHLIGRHNIMNTALAIAAIRESRPELSLHVVQEALGRLHTINGRLEPVPNDRGVGAYVDYAHTPDALDNVLRALCEIPHNRLICVLGAGGDRDKGKRPEMTRVALNHADLAILTTDNPRSESPRDIIRDMVDGVDPDADWWVRVDRGEAIHTAARLATEGDIVLVAGKGHETYQEINGERIHFDDREVLAEALAAPFEEPGDDDAESSNLLLAEAIDSLMVELLFDTEPLPKALTFSSVSLDSRTVQPGSLFIALQGENFDAHDYVPAVLEDPTCAAIVSRSIDSDYIYKVEDTLDALGVLASRYARLFGATRVGITGSVGKTTTKEYLHQILRGAAPTLKTLENQNNQIGLPKTLFRLRPQHRWAICEMGSNHIGEIAALAHIARPHMGVVTAIGASHLQYFGDLDGVWREKNDLLQSTSDVRIFPGDEPRFAGCKGVRFGEQPHNDYVLSAPEPTDDGLRFDVSGDTFEIASPAPHNARNAAIAAIAAMKLGVGANLIRERLRKPLRIHHRMEIERCGERTLIIDCYNANPDSMQAAIEFWKSFEPHKPHVAILGDMLELGEASETLHRNIATLTPDNATVLSVGRFALHYNASSHFNNVDLLLESGQLQHLPREAVILVKASHGVHLEKTIGRLK